MLKVIGGVPDGLMKAIADGAVTSNKPVIIQSDGKVADIDPTSASIPQSEGSPTAFTSSYAIYSNTTFDSTNNKVVTCYRDPGNSNYATAVVGTVSGNSISFGTPVVIFSGEQYDYMPTTFDSANGKVVVGITNTSFQACAVVGTVSGTSISFGSPVVIDSGAFLLSQGAATYDSGNGKVVFVYYYSSSSSRAIVGTVSGTSISFGSPTQYYAGAANEPEMDYDSSAGKVVIAHKPGNNSLRVIVGTVSGTSISFGSATTLESGNSLNPSGVNYVPAANKTVVTYHNTDGGSSKAQAVVGTISGTSISFGTKNAFANSANEFTSVSTPITANAIGVFYADADNSNYATFIMGTVSGTSISFNTKTAYENVNSANFWQSTYDSNAGKAVGVYNDSSTGRAVVVQTAYNGTNLTEENYVGIAQNSASTGNPVKIGIIGSVVGNQTGLTAGEKYYVQDDGSLSTTPDDPSVLAGTAISATQLVVKT